MNEKTKLLKLFDQVKNATLLFHQSKRETANNRMLSAEGKAAEQQSDREQFGDAMEGYRAEMLKIIDAREEDYVAYHTNEMVKRMRSGDYLNALQVNLKILEGGYMGRVEVAALLKAYEFDDMGTNMIIDTLVKIKSPFLGMVDSRVTVAKQLNAFESMRRVIKDKINTNLCDKVLSYAGDDGITFALFGAGYVAIEKETKEDLALNNGDVSLAKQNNADKSVARAVTSHEDIALSIKKDRRERQNRKNERDREKIKNMAINKPKE